MTQNNDAFDINRFLRALPKSEIHVHVEGEMRSETFVALADRNGIDLGGIDPGRVFDYSQAFDIERFMPVLIKMGEVMCSHEDFALVTYESLIDAADTSNCEYREISVNLHSHRSRNVPTEAILGGMVSGIRAAARDRGIRCRLIVDIDRMVDAADACEFVEEIARHRAEEIVAIGLVGWEQEHSPPRKYAEAYALAKRRGLHRTAHVAERCSPRWIEEALDVLDCERIDHGYRVMELPDLVRRCRDAQVSFTSTPTATSICDDWPMHAHPVGAMIRAGLKVSIGTDARSWGLTLQDEYETVAASLDMSARDMVGLCENAITASWQSEDEKRAARSRLHAAVADHLQDDTGPLLTQSP